MTRLVSPTVRIVDGSGGPKAACVRCGHELADAESSWKKASRVRETPLASVGPGFDTGYDGVVLRHFYCPACAVLLDTETARPSDPYLEDRLAP